MKRTFKTRNFNRWMRKSQLSDQILCAAIDEMSRGLIDADLGGYVIKKRIALPGRGKRSSTRILIATNKGNRWFFVFGFEKNDRANISDSELEALQDLASNLISSTDHQLDVLVNNDALQEICHDN